jgi:hypothetical protein
MIVDMKCTIINNACPETQQCPKMSTLFVEGFKQTSIAKFRDIGCASKTLTIAIVINILLTVIGNNRLIE